MADVARSPRGLSTLHEASGGDPSDSPRWQANMRYGGDQELLVALRTQAGDAWGILGLYREPGQPQFDADELDFLRTVAGPLAEGARRGLLIGEAADPEGPDAPGLVVLDEEWRVESLTPGAERWLAELPDGDWEGRAGCRPRCSRSRGARCARREGERAPGEVAVARVLSTEGRWIVLHGAPLQRAAPARRRDRRAGPPGPHHAAADGRLRADRPRAGGHPSRSQGDSTTEIADRLCVSPHTVQQHLKSVFEKTGVRSRRELVGKVFFAHYEPRLRDNERRATEDRPVRGGPMAQRHSRTA